MLEVLTKNSLPIFNKITNNFRIKFVYYWDIDTIILLKQCSLLDKNICWQDGWKFASGSLVGKNLHRCLLSCGFYSISLIDVFGRVIFVRSSPREPGPAIIAKVISARFMIGHRFSGAGCFPSPGRTWERSRLELASGYHFSGSRKFRKRRKLNRFSVSSKNVNRR